MPRKFKKIKGGFDIDKIKDVDAFNNLQSLVTLKTLEVLDSDDYFLDEKGDILEDIIIAEKIKYENAFLLDDNLFHIDGIYNWVIVNHKNTNPFTRNEISGLNVYKIKYFRFDTRLISNYSNYNNLKTEEELKVMGLFDKEGFFIDRNKKRIKDPLRQLPIKYDNAYLIGDYLFNIPSLYLEVITNNNRQILQIEQLTTEQINKIKFFDTNKLFNSNTFNNLRPLNELIKLKALNSQKKILVGSSIAKDPITKEEIKYENAIYINGFLYDINSISNFINDMNKDFFGNIISNNDIKKIRLFKFDISSIVNTSNSNNLKSLEELKRLGILDRDNFFLERNRNRFKNLITNKEIKYENAILINDILYDIQDIYISVFRENNDKDFFGNEISNENIKKIRLFRTYDDNRLDKTKPNNLKSLEELRILGLVNINNYFIDRNKNIIKDINSKQYIGYENAILIDGILYHMISIYNRVILNKYKTNFYDELISAEDKIKIQKIIFNTEEMYDSNNYNNLKSINHLKKLGYLTYYEIFKMRNDVELEDFYTKRTINYENAILINGYIYNNDALLNEIFDKGSIKDYFGNRISAEDFNKIKSFRINIERIYDPTSFNNLKSYEELDRLGYIDRDKYILDIKKVKYVDLESKLDILYKNAIIINGLLCDINKIFYYYKYNKKDYFNEKISNEDIAKILNYKIDIDRILDTSKPNNLKSLEELKEMGAIDKNNLLLKRDKNFVKEPIDKLKINYENAILINRTIYNINNLFKNVFSSHIFQDNNRNKISIEDLRKIFHYKNKIFDTSNPNKLKTFHELKRLKLINNEGFIQRNFYKYDYILINDFYSHKGIKYENAILINGFLYDINFIFEQVIFIGNNKDFFDLDISQEDYDKIYSFRHKFISDFSRPNNIRTLEQLQTLKVLNENNFFINEDGNEIRDLKTQRPIKYEDAFFLNDVLYDINELYRWVFEENAENYKKTFYSGEIISISDVIKIYNYKNNINPDLSMGFFVDVSQKVKKNYELIRELSINPDLEEIDKIIKDNYDLVLSISHIDVPRIVASIIFTNMLISIFNRLKRTDMETFEYREKLFRKICDISYYNFEIFIIYKNLKDNLYSFVFYDNFIKNLKIPMKDIEDKPLHTLYLIKLELDKVKDMILEFTTIIGNLKPKRKKLLTDIISRITNEYNKIFGYYLKTQEYVLKIFKYYNFYFINHMDGVDNIMRYLNDNILNLYENIEKQHKKSIRAFSKAQKANEEYKNYKSPTRFQSLRENIENIFTTRRVANYVSPKSSSSIKVSSSPKS